MATNLYLRNTTTNGISGYKDLLGTPGAGVQSGIVSTAASGTDIQWTATAGGTVLAWISPPVAVAFTLTAFNWDLWARESNGSANAKLRIRAYKYSGGSETELTGSPFDEGQEFNNMTMTNETGTADPSDTAFAVGDRLVIKLYITNAGTMATGYTCTCNYDAADGQTGDSLVVLAETVVWAVTQNITGTSDGIASTAGTWQAQALITGTSTGGSTTTSSLLGKVSISGTADGTASVTGTGILKGFLSGSSSGVAAVSGNIQGEGSLIAPSSIDFSVSGNLQGKGSLSGESNITFANTGTAYAFIPPSPIAGSCDFGFGKKTEFFDDFNSYNEGQLAGNGRWEEYQGDAGNIVTADGTITGNGTEVYDMIDLDADLNESEGWELSFEIALNNYADDSYVYIGNKVFLEIWGYANMFIWYDTEGDISYLYSEIIYEEGDIVKLIKRYKHLEFYRNGVLDESWDFAEWMGEKHGTGGDGVFDFDYDISWDGERLVRITLYDENLEWDNFRFDYNIVDLVTGTLQGKGSLSGQSVITFSVASIPIGEGELKGSVSIRFTDNAILKGTGKLSGSSISISSVEGNLSGTGKLTGVSEILFSNAAKPVTPSLVSNISGEANITFSQSAILKGKGELKGTSPVIFGSLSLLSGTGRLAGGSLLSFTQICKPSATGNKTGLSSLSFSIISRIGGRKQFIGSTQVVFTQNAIVGGRGYLFGSVVTSATVTGVISGLGQLLGIDRITFDQYGRIQGIRHGSGQTDILFDVIGKIKYQGQTWGLSDFAFDNLGNLKMARLHYETIRGNSIITLSVDGGSKMIFNISGNSLMTGIVQGVSPITVELIDESKITNILIGNSLIDVL